MVYKQFNKSGKCVYMGFSVDIWQLGVLMYTLLTRQPPYDSQNTSKTSLAREEWFSIVKNHKLGCKKVLWRERVDDSYEERLLSEIVSPPGMLLLAKMLQFNPEDRPSIEEVLQDPWFGMMLGSTV
jgi:serine/threonine protein kinase